MAGVDRKEAFDASETLGKSYNLKQLKIGQKMQARLQIGIIVTGVGNNPLPADHAKLRRAVIYLKATQSFVPMRAINAPKDLEP